MGAALTLRRYLVITGVVVVELMVLAGAPLWLTVSAGVSLWRRDSRPLRSTALVVAFAGLELSALSRVVSGIEDWQQFACSVLDAGERLTCRILDLRLDIEAGSATPEQLAQSPGLVVLARHCGPGDSLFIAWLLMVHAQLTVRIVLKQAMRWEPAVDLAADHLPLCFVRAGRGDGRQRVADLAADLSQGHALLIFPEGGNFSWQRWQSAIRELSRAGRHREARQARDRTHTLPPKLGGTVAALQAAPHADVLLLAHSGLAGDGRARAWWRVPVHRTMTIRTLLVPAADVPRDAEGIEGWLDPAWARIDTWVESRADLDGLAG